MWEFLLSIKALIVEYYPIIVTTVVAIGGAIGVAYVTFTQAKAIVQPILDKIQDFRNKDEENQTLSDKLKAIEIDTMKADLLYKIQNTSVSPELTLVYQTQLDKLQEITTKATDVVTKVEDTTSKYL
jgi:cell shape-determining protein MreC